MPMSPSRRQLLSTTVATAGLLALSACGSKSSSSSGTGGASQILRDGVRVVVGPEETSKIKGEDLFLGFIRQELGVESEA